MVGLHHLLNGQELGNLWEMVRDREAWHAAGPGVTKSWTQLSDRTTTYTKFCLFPPEPRLPLAFPALPQEPLCSPQRSEPFQPPGLSRHTLPTSSCSGSPPCLLKEPVCACFLLPWMPWLFPLLPQQSGSDPLRDSQCEEQGLTILQGQCLLLLCREVCLLPSVNHCSLLKGPFLQKLPGPLAQAMLGWWVLLGLPALSSQHQMRSREQRTYGVLGT